MKNFLLVVILLCVFGCCGNASAEGRDWTVEEQCQVYNKWSVRVTETAPLTYSFDAMDPSYFQHPPIMMTDSTTGEKIVGGICPSDAIGNYGLYNYYRQ